MGLLIALNLHLPKLIIPLFVLLPPALNILNKTIPRLQHRTIELTLTHNLRAKLKHTHLQIEQSKVNTILVVLVVKQRNTALTVNYPQLHTTTLSQSLQQRHDLSVTLVQTAVQMIEYLFYSLVLTVSQLFIRLQQVPQRPHHQLAILRSVLVLKF